MEHEEIPGPDGSEIRVLGDRSTSRSDAGHAAVDRISPEEFARGFVRRPGMYIGATTHERAVGFVLGLEHALLMRARSPEEVAALPTSRLRALMERQLGDDEQAAIAHLELVLVAVLQELQEEV